jgi:predicted nucleic acid-binding protein
MTLILAAIPPPDVRWIYREWLSARHQCPFGTDSSAARSTRRKLGYTRDERLLYLSVVSIGELRRGFTILPVTHSIADRWGLLDGQCQLRGTPLNTADGMIAATAIEHDLTLVSRNVKDFMRLLVEVVNPWAD